MDLLVPYLVIGTALAALAAVGTDRRGWVAAVAGAVLYAQGHGMHLTANSISNAQGDLARAWLHVIWRCWQDGVPTTRPNTERPADRPEPAHLMR